ncbi:hypothetical protein GLYMA_16G121800v4 [Glycine max]|uniref:Uncharacterized protein n=1 Tax=Glycine max TaxID=3847 RepID=A0A0R0FY71_SOYBN|nr:hypothetical protein GYH30_044899 [Glycine max]KRH07977.1 hypothetical protein GLYMA_16G121800v4 [Glycine max]
MVGILLLYKQKGQKLSWYFELPQDRVYGIILPPTHFYRIGGVIKKL